MVVALVGLDDVLVERGGGLVPRPLAELDELAVLHDGDGFPGELARGHAFHGGPEGGQVPEQRAVALGQGVEAPGIEAQLAEALDHQAVVLGLVAHLAGEGQLHLRIVGGDHPPGRDLGGFDLILQRDLEEVEDVQVTLHFRPEGVVGRQELEQLLVRRVQFFHELFGCHDGHLVERDPDQERGRAASP